MKLVPNVVGSQMQHEIGSKCINEEGHKCNKRDRLRITFLVTNVLPRTRVERRNTGGNTFAFAANSFLPHFVLCQWSMIQALNTLSTNIQYVCDLPLRIFVTNSSLQLQTVLHLWPTPPLLHNQVTLVTHSLSQCGDPYYIWHQFRIAFGTTTSYYICDLN